jgi:hypothetical protein
LFLATARRAYLSWLPLRSIIRPPCRRNEGLVRVDPVVQVDRAAVRLLATVVVLVVLLLAVLRPGQMLAKVDLLPAPAAQVLAVADHLPNRLPQSKSV